MFGDFSSNNGTIDVAAYAAGRVGVLRRRPRWISLKVSQGTGYTWPSSPQYSDDAHRAGLHVVHYHWLEPDSDAGQQAELFTAHTRANVRPGDLAMLDLEPTYRNGQRVPDVSGKHRAAQIAQWAAGVVTMMPGVPIICYLGNFYAAELGPVFVQSVKRFPVILADYDRGTLPNPYGFRVIGRQFTDKQRFPGVQRVDNDANRWRRDPARLFGFPPARRHT